MGAVLLLIIASPVMLITALLVRINIGSPVIFCQPRPGLNEKVFNLYKFRSMKNVDLDKGLLTDEQRLTRFGKILRSTSLDELPSLWNVLIGEMSFVGPRPLLVDYLSRYSVEQAKRHNVKPGLTGLAQVSGRNLVSWNRRFELDVKYVEEVSFQLDVKVLISTISTVLRKTGINSQESATMQGFTGNE
jgi:lipopolysaccharide/colanic/teichoic acid biosynthesis glycosyltransferase